MNWCAAASAGELTDETRILYVSPLKALSNDVRVNLEIPLAGIADLARAGGRASAGHSSGGAHRRHSHGRARADDAGKRRTYWLQPRSRCLFC